MKYFSLFSGIGGFEKGIIQAHVVINNRNEIGGGKKNSSKTSKNGKRLVATKDERISFSTGSVSKHSDRIKQFREPTCMGFSELDYEIKNGKKQKVYAKEIYKKHFPEHKDYGDITKIPASYLPDFDLLVGGFPCQSFSIAGKRGGFSDTRGTLFFDIARIIKAKRPRFLCLENVKGLLSHKGGNTFTTIINTLDELGYDVQWQVLNSKDFGVPQNRERVYIVGHLRGTARPKIFPFIGSGEENSEAITSTAIDANYFKGVDNHGQRTMIIHNVYGGFKEKKLRTFEKYSPTIRTPAGGGHIPGVVHKGRVRKLTPVECLRLQGFPDFWCDGLSDTQKYKCAGNAVTVNVVQAIMEKLL